MARSVHDMTDAAALARPIREMSVQQERHTNRRINEQKKNGDSFTCHASGLIPPLTKAVKNTTSH
jgi:hypothetical protein